MAQNQLVQARINKVVKEKATVVLADMGLTISDAVRILLTKIAREKMVPLELLTPNSATLVAMEEAKTSDLPHVHSVNELFKELNADD